MQGTGGSPTGSDPEHRVGDQDTGSPGRPVSSWLPVPIEPGIVVQEQDPFGHFSTAFSIKRVLQLHQQRLVILRVDSLAIWKIISEEDAVLIPTNRGENFSGGFLQSDFFLGGGGRVSRYATTPLVVPLSPGHSDITRFCLWPPIATGNHLDRAEKNSKFGQTSGMVDVFDTCSGISGPT